VYWRIRKIIQLDADICIRMGTNRITWLIMDNTDFRPIVQSQSFQDSFMKNLMRKSAVTKVLGLTSKNLPKTPNEISTRQTSSNRRSNTPSENSKKPWTRRVASPRAKQTLLKWNRSSYVPHSQIDKQNQRLSSLFTIIESSSQKQEHESSGIINVQKDSDMASITVPEANDLFSDRPDDTLMRDITSSRDQVFVSNLQQVSRNSNQNLYSMLAFIQDDRPNATYEFDDAGVHRIPTAREKTLENQDTEYAQVLNTRISEISTWSKENDVSNERIHSRFSIIESDINHSSNLDAAQRTSMLQKQAANKDSNTHRKSMFPPIDFTSVASTHKRSI